MNWGSPLSHQALLSFLTDIIEIEKMACTVALTADDMSNDLGDDKSIASQLNSVNTEDSASFFDKLASLVHRHINMYHS